MYLCLVCNNCKLPPRTCQVLVLGGGALLFLLAYFTCFTFRFSWLACTPLTLTATEKALHVPFLLSMIRFFRLVFVDAWTDPTKIGKQVVPQRPRRTQTLTCCGFQPREPPFLHLRVSHRLYKTLLLLLLTGHQYQCTTVEFRAMNLLRCIFVCKLWPA